MLVALMLVATTGSGGDGDEIHSREGQAGPATAAQPESGGHPTEQELEAARKAVEAGPLPGPPVAPAGTPAPPPETGYETQASPLPPPATR
jgi:hypothetical protein